MRVAWRRVSCLGLALIAGAAGCTISVQPWTRHGGASAQSDPVHPVAGAIPAGGIPGPLPSNLLPRSAPPPGIANESISQLIKQYNEADDHRKALLDQVQVLTRQVKERDDGLRRASFEMEDSVKQMRRAKDDIRQWQSEMEEMRERVVKLEEERNALKPIISEILTELDRKELERRKETLKFRGAPPLR